MKARAKWILIAEDQQEIREYIRDCVTEKLGDEIKVVEAEDGSEATHRLTYQAFDCIITDLKMPRRDGAKFIQFVKQQTLNQNTPIIVVTGQPDANLNQTYTDVQVLLKPFDPEELGNLVEKQLKMGRLNQRVSANTLNAFVEIVEGYLGQLLHEQVVLQPPTQKASGDNIEGEFAVCSSFKGQDECILCVGIDSSIMAKLQEAYNTSHQLKDVMGALGTLDHFSEQIFTHLSDRLEKLNSQRPVRENQQVFLDKQHIEYQNIMSRKGLVIPLMTKHGSIYLATLNYAKPSEAGFSKAS